MKNLIIIAVIAYSFSVIGCSSSTEPEPEPLDFSNMEIHYRMFPDIQLAYYKVDIYNSGYVSVNHYLADSTLDSGNTIITEEDQGFLSEKFKSFNKYDREYDSGYKDTDEHLIELIYAGIADTVFVNLPYKNSVPQELKNIIKYMEALIDQLIDYPKK